MQFTKKQSCLIKIESLRHIKLKSQKELVLTDFSNNGTTVYKRDIKLFIGIIGNVVKISVEIFVLFVLFSNYYFGFILTSSVDIISAII